MFFVLVYKLVFFLLYDVPVQINVTIFDSICRDDVINREFIPIRLIQSFAMIIITRTCNLNIVLNEWPAYIICGKNFISYFFLFSLNVKGYISDLTNLSNGSNIWPRIKNTAHPSIRDIRDVPGFRIVRQWTVEDATHTQTIQLQTPAITETCPQQHRQVRTGFCSVFPSLRWLRWIIYPKKSDFSLCRAGVHVSKRSLNSFDQYWSAYENRVHFDYN